MFTLPYKAQIGGDVLLNGASPSTGGGKTIQQRDLLMQLSGRCWFDGLAIVSILQSVLGIGSHCRHIDPTKRLITTVAKGLGHLVEPLVTAWF